VEELVSRVTGMIMFLLRRSLTFVLAVLFISMVVLSMLIVAVRIMRFIELLCFVPFVLFTGRKTYENGEDACAKNKKFHYEKNPYPTSD
jgi:Ca2+/Na+ antiporter